MEKIKKRSNIFIDSQEKRNDENRQKDLKTIPILEAIPLNVNSDVIFMQGKWGPEKAIAESKGVKRHRIRTIEKDKGVWAAQKEDGYTVTPVPMELEDAVYYYGTEDKNDGFDCIYLDLQSILTPRFQNAIRWIFKARMLKHTSTLIITTGYGRSPMLAYYKNHKFKTEIGWTGRHPPTTEVMRRILDEERMSYLSLLEFPYKGHCGIPFVVTVTKF